MDKYMIEFCDVYDFNIAEFNDKDIRKLERTFIFQRFKLSKLIKEIMKEIEKDIMKTPFKIKKLFNKFKNKNREENSFSPTDEELKNMIQKLGKDVVIYGNKEQMERIEKIKENIK